MNFKKEYRHDDDDDDDDDDDESGKHWYIQSVKFVSLKIRFDVWKLLCILYKLEVQSYNYLVIYGVTFWDFKDTQID